jgi:hypothetical protein
LKSARLHRVGYGLFAVYLVIAFLLRNHQTFFDEGSNLNLAANVLKGLHLYRDLFENHFPLGVYCSAGIIFFAGTSLPLVRLGVLSIDAALLLATMRVSGLAFPVGLAVAVWAFISPYYFGNLLLYDNLAMLGGIALGAVCFAALARGLEPSRGMFALLAIAGFIATMSSPFFGLVTAIAIGALFFAPQIPRRFVLKLAITITLPIAAYFLYLAATGALGSFYSYAVVFNATTYQKYASIQVLPLIGKQLLLFDLFSSNWIRSFNPLRFDPITFVPRFDHWIFSGLFYRAAALFACGLFAWRRNYRTAVFVYLFTAALPLREDDGFHAAPFVLFCLFLMGVLLEEASPLMLALGLLPTLVLAASGARYVVRHALQSDFEPLLAEARGIREAAQNQSDVRLGHYPYGNYMSYLTGIRPLSKYVDFYPWVAEIAQADVDAELAQAANVLLVMDTTGSIWSYPNDVTLASEIAFAKKHLIKENFGPVTVYVSPWLTLQDAPGTEAALSALATALPDAPVKISGAWSKDAGDVYKSTGAGVIRFGPLQVAGQGQIAIPILTGPDNHNLSVILRDTSTGKVLARLDPPPVRSKWWAWRPYLPQDPELTCEVIAEEKGASLGQWIILGWPHWLRQPHFEKASHPAIYRHGDWQIYGAGRTYHLGGDGGDIPVTGDWDGSGKTAPGIYKPATGEWELSGTTKTYRFGGQAGDIPVTGDWNGSGKTAPGIYKPATGEWQLYGSNKPVIFGGQNGDIPVTGDWNGSGKWKPGIYRPGSGEWLLYGDDRTYHFGGIAGDIPVVGDWNGDGRSKPGIFRRGSSWLLDIDGNYKFEDLGTDVVITFGSPGDKPVPGAW